MAIKIQTQKPEIPIEIGNLKFSFDVSDESVKAFREQGIKLQKELEQIEAGLNDDSALDATKDALRRGFDLFLGEGAFDKIYELSPSIMIVADYFVRLSEGIEREIQNMGYSRTQQHKAQKYIQNKKRQNRR